MKKGFTLIELLAVIVILAFIALIVTPVIIGIINDSRKQGNDRSAELYISAVEQALARKNLTTRLINTTCNVKEDGNLDCDGIDVLVEVANTKATAGTIVFNNAVITKVKKLKIGNYFYDMEKGGKLVRSDANASKPCTLNDKDGDGEASLSDEVTCDTESFYVMSTDGNTVTMLSKYNLDVGGIFVGMDVTPIENPTGLQKAEARGRVDGEDAYGIVAFSSENYWWDNSNNAIKSTYPTTSTYSISGTQYNVAYIYDSNSNLYNYVNEYANKLKEKGVSSATATLMSYEQATSLGCARNDNQHYGWCSTKDTENNATNGTAPEWLYSTTYWLGSSNPLDAFYVWSVFSYGGFDVGCFDIDDGTGVRPVVNISKDEI